MLTVGKESLKYNTQPEGERGTLTILDSVTKIGAGAFQFNKTLETVIMQEGVKKIENRAFNQCINLKSVNMPESITEIGIWAFNVCEKFA